MSTRRRFLALALASAAAPPALAAAMRRLGLSDRPWLDAALRTEAWLRRSMREAGTGAVWPADPLTPDGVSTSLYTGTAGVVLFYLELHAATGRDDYLRVAERGARYLAATPPEEPGLYLGLAGSAFVLERTAAAGGDAGLRDAARRAALALRDRITTQGDGAAWNDVTDIIGGSAGIALTLLHLEQRLDLPELRDVAVRAGRRLLALGKTEAGGLTWMMSPSVPRNMPNFSHGTAGVGYFLARLHRASGDAAFREGAEGAARYLQAIAVARGDGAVIRHHDGGGENLFYLSWCHGPAGTARLFHELGRTEPAWLTMERRLANGIRAMGVPERSPGFWNNISQCCGNAGVVEFALDRARVYSDPDSLAWARVVAADLMRRATADGDGLKWVQAEHRVQPENLVAQTGFMQGAAGVGTMLLHLDAAERGQRGFVVLPDSPY